MSIDKSTPFERAMNNPHPYVAAPHVSPAVLEHRIKVLEGRVTELADALRDVVSAHAHSMPTKEFNRRGGSWTVIRGKALDKAVKLLARIDAGKG